MGNCLRGAQRSQHNRLRESTSMENVQASSQHPELPPPYEEEIGGRVFNISSTNESSLSNNMTEEQQIRLAQRLGLIQHLPSGTYDGTKKKRECAICMCEYSIGDPIRFLPCLHIYHQECIDDWLLRSFTCPLCTEPVDAALISTFYTSE